jgi:hypothetical protein
MRRKLGSNLRVETKGLYPCRIGWSPLKFCAATSPSLGRLGSDPVSESRSSLSSARSSQILILFSHSVRCPSIRGMWKQIIWTQTNPWFAWDKSGKTKINFEQTKSTKLFPRNAKEPRRIDPPLCLLATPPSPSCGSRIRSEPLSRCRAPFLPPRCHTLRSVYSMYAWNTGLLCPPATRVAPVRRLRRPGARKSGTQATQFSLPLTISLSIFAHFHPNCRFSLLPPL